MERVMDNIVKFNNQSSGRDKLFRLVQYSSRIIWSNLESRNKDKDIINKLKNLEYSLSTARKLYRFGRSIDIMYAALNSLHLDDPALRCTTTFSKINMSLYLFSDHVLWLGRVGLVNIDKGKWSRLSYKLWLYYLVMNLARDVYEIIQIIDKLKNCSISKELHFVKLQQSNSVIFKLSILYELLKTHKDVVVDTLKNGCDVCLPLAQLGYLSFSSSTVGILGVISSIAGMLPLIDPSYKLCP